MSPRFDSLEEITVGDFYQLINQENDILLLDVGNDRDCGLWKILE